MRVIIAGSRTITDYARLCDAVRRSGFAVSRVVSGMAAGVDSLAVRYAALHGLPCDRFPAEWRKYGRSAGYRRNVQMAQHADALIALWDGQSPGTRHMIETAKARGLAVFVLS
jgi:YspA, cpYpsA-related SLOG family